MRSSKEMLDLILSVANEDDRIRHVVMVGSRANENCPVDQYQDFDIEYHVTDVSPYWDNMDWIISKFGKPSLIQKPESMKLIPPDNNGSYVYLMIFPDGNRIDLMVTREKYENNGEPAIILMDKDGAVGPFEFNKKYRFITKPEEIIFQNCCNEFHWCLNNVAKGIARDELSYAMEMQNHYVRDMLIKMLEWYVGCHNDFDVTAGKLGKYLKKYLPEDIYIRFKATYSDAETKNMIKAAFDTLYLFGDVARDVAKELHFVYDEEEEQGIENYMKQVLNEI